MPADHDHDPEAPSFVRRREQWSRESEEVRTASRAPGNSVEATVLGYQRSRTGKRKLPAPALSQSGYDALTQRHRGLVTRLSAALLLLPVLVVLAVVLGPVALKVVLLALLLPTAALAIHHSRALARLEQQRHLTLTRGLADAWADWIAARERLAQLGNASQAYAALAANEVRMETLVLSLAEADADPSHRDTAEHTASRDWLFSNAAKAVALAAAEQELDALTQGRVAAAELQLAPEGDDDALDRALETARELGRTDDPHP